MKRPRPKPILPKTLNPGSLKFMAFSSILRRSATSLVPLARRASRLEQIGRPAVLSALNRACVSQRPSFIPYPNALCFNTAATQKRPTSDENLLRVIENEITCAKESDDYNQVDDRPSGFPFQMEDTPGLQTITLTREYQGELVKVEVHMPDIVTGGRDEDVDDNADDEKANQSSLPLTVTFSKKNAPTLEFTCTAFPDEISIDSLAVRNPENEAEVAYEGPDFNDLDEKLQQAFVKYLEIRGIKPSTTNFLHEYMINKDSREYLGWLENLKKFIEA